MGTIANRIIAFVRRDFYIASSYKLQFVFKMSTGFFSIATFYFISQLISAESTRSVQVRYGADYFSFVLIGLATTGILHVGISGFAERLRIDMTEGSLEMMFAAPIGSSWIIIMPCIWSFLFESIRATVVIALGVFVFGAHLEVASLPTCGFVLVLTMAAYSVFGLMSAGIIMIVKRGDPINWFFAQASALVAGAYFPIELLPDWIAWLPKLLPMTYGYDAVRLTMLSGATTADVTNSLLVLAGFSAIGLPVALTVCSLAVDKAKRDGTLGTF